MNFRPKPICFSNKPPFFSDSCCQFALFSQKKGEKKTAGESAVVIYAHRRALFLVTAGRRGGQIGTKKKEGDGE